MLFNKKTTTERNKIIGRSVDGSGKKGTKPGDLFANQKDINKNKHISKSTRYNMLIAVDTLNFGDIARVIVDLANYLVKKNVGVTILTNEATMKNLLDVNVNLVINQHKSLKNHIKYAKFLRDVFTKYEIDIANVFSLSFVQEIRSLSLKRHIPMIATIGEIYNTETRFDRFLANIMVNADKVIVMSEFIRDYILNEYEVDIKKIKLIINGIDLSLFKTDEITEGRLAEIAEKIDVNASYKRILLCPSRFCDEKGQSFLLDVLAKVENKDYVCVMMGNLSKEGKVIENLCKKIRQLNLENNVRIVDNVDDMPAAYLLSYAVICVSQKDEAFCRMPIEAAAMRRPIISTVTGASNMYIIDNKTGFLVRVGGIKELKEAIEKILDMPDEEYQQMCDNANKYARKHFDMNKSLFEFDKAANELLNKFGCNVMYVLDGVK